MERGTQSVPKRLGRRQFLKLAGAAAVAAAVPAAAGYGLIHAAEGERPNDGSPYAEVGGKGAMPTRGVGAPILLLLNGRSNNPFGAYLGEILRAEGLSCFQMANVSEVDSSALEPFQLVVLAEGPLDTVQAEALREYVHRGGRLIAMRPDVRLADLFGLEAAVGTEDGGYVSIAPEHPIATGMAGEALQFHGAADRYRLAGAHAIAWLHSDPGGPPAFPAVSLSGRTALWAFDLARSVVLTRQGNPAWADQERDGKDGIRPHDAFVGWIDLERMAVPQADEHMRLLSRVILEMLADALPLPRLWYFAGQADGVLIATGDSHQNPSSAIEDVLARVERRGGHMSVYYAPTLSSHWKRAARKAKRWVESLPLLRGALANSAAPPAPREVAGWRARGHEFALHPYVEGGLEAGWERYWQEFTGMGYGPVPPTVRTHRVLWSGWVDSARIQATYGIGLNLDYYHIGPAFRQGNGEWAYGYFTGSGLPLRFVDEGGRILGIYQQLTQLVDEHLLEVPWGGHVKLEPEAAIEVSKMLLRHSVEKYPSALVAQFHVDPYAVGGRYADLAARWLAGTLDAAVERGIPIWSAEEWLAFVRARQDTALKDLSWDAAGQRLSFQWTVPDGPYVQLTVMVPLRHADGRLAEVEIDGQVAVQHPRTLSGVDYVCVSAEGGLHSVVARYV